MTTSASRPAKNFSTSSTNSATGMPRRSLVLGFSSGDDEAMTCYGRVGSNVGNGSQFLISTGKNTARFLHSDKLSYTRCQCLYCNHICKRLPWNGGSICRCIYTDGAGAEPPVAVLPQIC